jgi:hypothetical protein
LPRLALADAQCGATQLSNSPPQANDLEWAFQSGFFERMGYRVRPPRLRDVISI